VIHVNYDQAVGYAEWLSDKTGKKYRLLSEAEWEYAARGGSDKAQFWGSSPDRACQFANAYDVQGKARYDFAKKHNMDWPNFSCDDGYPDTAPVGSFKPNAFGLYDMLGNVWEWVEDCYNKSYDGAPTDGRTWATGDCSRRVFRGGSWYSKPARVRSAGRLGFEPTIRNFNVGFRVARTLP
jgi:formylglycine-generating enzyme required for sulfatase activity